jgi:hypothetical protein
MRQFATSYGRAVSEKRDQRDDFLSRLKLLEQNERLDNSVELALHHFECSLQFVEAHSVEERSKALRAEPSP